jgi:hypothetical protein
MPYASNERNLILHRSEIVTELLAAGASGLHRLAGDQRPPRF